MWIDNSGAIAVLLTVQVLGVLGLILVRMSERWAQRYLCQLFFFSCMLLVGVATAITLMFNSVYWVMLGGTLGVMVVGATLDCGGYHGQTDS